jgi:hypothetical protein
MKPSSISTTNRYAGTTIPNSIGEARCQSDASVGDGFISTPLVATMAAETKTTRFVVSVTNLIETQQGVIPKLVPMLVEDI